MNVLLTKEAMIIIDLPYIFLFLTKCSISIRAILNTPGWSLDHIKQKPVCTSSWGLS